MGFLKDFLCVLQFSLHVSVVIILVKCFLFHFDIVCKTWGFNIVILKHMEKPFDKVVLSYHLLFALIYMLMVHKSSSYISIFHDLVLRVLLKITD